MLARDNQGGREKKDQSLGRELQGLAIRRVLAEGDAAWAIMETAQEKKADLIMMPSYGHTFSQFLLGSVTAKVLHGTECPVWTDAHVEVSPVQQFSIRHILCAIDLLLTIAKLCRGPSKWSLNLVLTSRSFTLLLGGVVGAGWQPSHSRVELIAAHSPC